MARARASGAARRGAAFPASRHKSAADRPMWHSREGSEGAPSIRALFTCRLPIARSGSRHVPGLLDLRARITNYLGDRAEAMKIGLYLFHVGCTRVRGHIHDETDFWERHVDFFKQLRAATVESRFGINCHGLEVDA